jgi:DNA-binding SARP family transcriptional activator
VSYRVGLFGGFEVTRDGVAVSIPSESHRLVAFLAMHDSSLERSYVAGRLWCDSDEERARANLRSTLWRLRRHVDDLVVADATSVALAPDVATDVRDLHRRSSVLWEVGTEAPSTVHADLDHRPFALEFLPGWYDDWVIVERERVHQLCLHCLEAIASILRERGLFGAAIQALLTSIALDPLRESPHRQLIAVHLAEGNRSEAVRQYREFADVLDRELGLEPSPTMRAQLADCGGLEVASAPIHRARESRVAIRR